jgi:hypothetical protein
MQAAQDHRLAAAGNDRLRISVGSVAGRREAGAMRLWGDGRGLGEQLGEVRPQ